MKSLFTTVLICLTSSMSIAQEKREELLKQVSGTACACVDSIKLSKRSNDDVSKSIGECLKRAATSYQLGVQKLVVGNEREKKSGKKKRKKDHEKNDAVAPSAEPRTAEFEECYFEIERYMMENCPELTNAAKSDNTMSDHSMSDNPAAVTLYESGNSKANAGNFDDAIVDYKSALAIDSMFSFAWDNLGLTYRKAEKYDQAIAAYRKSLEVTPSGKVPLQNIAIVYEYQKLYQKAIDAYQELAAVDKDNAEVYYGIGRLYASQLGDLEKGLDNLCTAYRIYVEQGSPYRTDAEKLISAIAAEMKKQGKEKRFNEILKEHHLDAK